MAGNSASEAAAIGRQIRAAKQDDPYAFAFGLAKNTADSALVVDKSKAPKALETEAKRSAGTGARVFFGTVHCDGSKAVFATEDAPTNGEKALTDWLKHHKIGLTASVGKPAPPVSDSDGEEEEGPRIYSTEMLTRRFRFALRDPVHFAFGPGKTPEESLLALHPRRDGQMLFRALRRENHAIRGSWGRLEMDGRVAMFRCEEAPIPGLRKRVRAFLRDRDFRYRVKVFGPEGEVVEPGDEEEDAQDLAAEQRQQGVQDDATLLAELRQRMQQMLPVLQEIAKAVPPRAAAIRDQYHAFDVAQKANQLESAQTAFNMLRDLGRTGRVEMNALQEMRKRLDALLPELQAVAARTPELRDRIRDDWRQCDAAIKAGEARQASELLTELAALAQAQAGAQPGIARGTVAHRQMLLRWRRAQSTVAANLQTLSQALLANRAVQDDPRFPQVQRAVPRLARLVPDFGEKLDDALDAAMNAGDQAQAQGLNRAALDVLAEYRTKLRAQPALSKLEALARAVGAGDLPMHSEFEAAIDELQQGLAAAA